MSAILVTVAKTSAPQPGANAFASTTITVVDAANSTQTASVNGSESPPWSAAFSNVAVGACSLSAVDVDTTGAAMGAAVTGSITVVNEAPPPPQFPSSSGISATQTA